MCWGGTPSNTAGVTKRSAIDFFRSYARDLRKDTRVPTAILFKNEHPPVAYFGKVPPDEIVRWLSTGEPACGHRVIHAGHGEGTDISSIIHIAGFVVIVVAVLALFGLS